ncbi:MAG: glycosyltransferase [Saprospiraceae bacterium]|nr:glycosyltransferase [Saprospiraceae bacterium]
MNSFSTNALIIFLRLPELGKVKTRLARTIGEVQALEIYKQLIDITFGLIDHDHFTTYLYFDPDIDQTLVPPNCEARIQSGDSLGVRMHRAFDEILDKHKHAVIIGADCPYITTDLINHAFSLLETDDVVIGPASDGGYYLLGLRENNPLLFSEVRWGSDEGSKQP